MKRDVQKLSASENRGGEGPCMKYERYSFGDNCALGGLRPSPSLLWLAFIEDLKAVC